MRVPEVGKPTQIATFAVGTSIPVAVATAAERRALARGLDGILRGEYVTLNDLKNDLESRPRRRRK